MKKETTFEKCNSKKLIKMYRCYTIEKDTNIEKKLRKII